LLRRKFIDYLVLFSVLWVFLALTVHDVFSLPLGEAPDETSHFATVRFVALQGRPPLDAQERARLGEKGDEAPLYHTLAGWWVRLGGFSLSEDLKIVADNPQRRLAYDARKPLNLLHTEDELPPFQGTIAAWYWARLPSMFLGALTVMIGFAIARLLFPARRAVALSAAAFAAFVPRSVINGSVINDDNLLFFLCALAFYLMVYISLKDGAKGRSFLALGTACALALLTKYSSVGLVPPLALLGIILVRKHGWHNRQLFRNVALIVAPIVLVAGPWYVFILLRFNRVSELGWVGGLFVPFGQTNMARGVLLGVKGFVETYGLVDWLDLMFRSFWLEYGWMRVFASSAFYIVAAGLLLLPVAGWGLFLRRRPRLREHYWLVALTLAYVLSFTAIVVLRYMLTGTADTAQGRHLYPVLPVLATAWSFGLVQLTQNRTGQALALFGTASALVGLSALGPALYILPVYTPYLPVTTQPPSAADVGTPLNLNLGNGATLLGYKLVEHAAWETSLSLELHWRSDQESVEDFAAAFCLVGPGGELCHYGYPVYGDYPPRAWEKGDYVTDTHPLPLPDCLPSGLYTPTLTFYPLSPTGVEPAAEPLMESISLPPVMLAGAAPATTLPALWVDDRKASGDSVSVGLNHTLTLLSAGGDVSLQAADGEAWLPFSTSVFHCPSGDVHLSSFLADAGLRPGSYRWQGADLPSISLQARWRSLAALPPQAAQAVFSDQVALVDSRLNTATIQPGQSIELTLGWQALRWMRAPYSMAMRLVDPQQAVVAQQDWVLGERYGSLFWAPGEVVSDHVILPTAKTMPPGIYNVTLEVYTVLEGQPAKLPATTSAGSTDQAISVGEMRVLDREYASPPCQTAVDALLGAEKIELACSTLSANRLAPGKALSLALVWRSHTPIKADYTVFTQLVGPDGKVWAQQDNYPQQNRLPTSRWLPEETVIDRYTLSVPADAPPGDYRLLAGMYDWHTGQRLTITAGHGTAADNALELAQVRVE
jgi:4-amino-4-deoxy-L-arabinose transferase-like glycosyltransferase